MVAFKARRLAATAWCLPGVEVLPVSNGDIRHCSRMVRCLNERGNGRFHWGDMVFARAPGAGSRPAETGGAWSVQTVCQALWAEGFSVSNPEKEIAFV